MTMYTEIILCYDISENKTRRQIIKELKDIGLIPVQESVFWGRILSAEIKSIKRLFDEKLKKGTDSAFIVRTSFASQLKEFSFGYNDPTLFEERNYEIF